MNKKEKLFIKYFKRPLAYKIDKNDEKIYQRTVGELITIIFLLVLSVVIYNYYIDISNLKEDWLKILLLTVGISLPVILVSYILLNNLLERVRNIQKLAELIFTSGYFIKPQLVSNTSVSKGLEDIFNVKGLVKSRESYKDLYFPKFYIKQNKNEIQIYIRLDGSKFQKEFLELETKLEYTFKIELKDKQVIDEFIIYTLAKFSLKDRLNFSDDNVEDNKLKLMKNVIWEFRKSPHALIVGGTGTGKSYLIFYLIKEILKKGYYLNIIDPKISDLTKLGYVSKKNLVVYEKEDVINLLDDVTLEMDNRYKEMLSTGDNFGEDYVVYGIKPYFLIFDELLAFISVLDNKEKKEVMSKLTNIVVKGRQAGVFVIFATQRPDTDVLDGKVRDQLGLRIALGSLSNDGYKMIFGETNTAYKEIGLKGTGYYQIKEIVDRPKVFLSPYIVNGDLVGQEIMELIQERGL